jgi:FAD/FMN-containing dehydrogenase
MTATPFWADRLAHAVGGANVKADGGRVVVRPGAPAEIVDVVRVAAEVGAIVGVVLPAHEPEPGGDSVTLDLSRMHNVLHVDETSLLVSAQAGVTVAALEQLLAERGLTLGPLPTWSRERTLGALLAAPRASEASPRHGRFVQNCAGIAAILPDGTEVTTRLAPRKATGPDLMHAIIGARGTLGLITSATVRVQRRQETRLEASFRLPSLVAALMTARALLVRGGRPADLTVLASGVLSLHVDGPEPLVQAERALCESIARELGGQPVPFAPPPRATKPPYERAVALETIDREVLAPSSLVGDAIRVVGWHVGGACVVDVERPASPPAAPHVLWSALKRRLDPDRRFAGWPGA